MKNCLSLAVVAAATLFAGSAFADGASMGGITMSDHATSTITTRRWLPPT